MLLRCRGRIGNVSPVMDTSIHLVPYRQKFLVLERWFVGRAKRREMLQFDWPARGNGFLMVNVNCEQARQNYQSCNGNGVSWKPKKGRYIPRKRKGPDEKAVKESGKGISNERERNREGKERIYVSSPLAFQSLFFFHPVEVVNGFLLGDLPRCVNASAGWIESPSLSVFFSLSLFPSLPLFLFSLSSHWLLVFHPFFLFASTSSPRTKASFHLFRLSTLSQRCIVSISGNRFQCGRKRPRRRLYTRSVSRVACVF